MTLPVLFLRSPLDRVYKRDERGRFGSGGTGGTVRKALADAKTKDELTAAAEAAAARVTGRPEGDIRFFARHSDLEVAKQHFEGVLQGLERFPHAPLSTVSDFDPDNPGAMHYDADVAQTIAYSGMGYEKGSINFNAQYSAHPDIYQKVLDQSAEDAFTTSSVRTPHLVAPTMQGVALHEFGHVLTQQQHPLVGGGSGPPKVPAKKIAAELNPGGKTTADFIRDEISEYATTNQHELSAEAFADVVHNGSSASHVSRAIYNEIAALYPEDAQAVTWLRPLDRTYKRDERGRFGSGGGSVRHSLAEAQTAEQVAAVASQELGDRLGHPVSVNLTGLDVGLARQHMEGVLRGAERFSNGVGLTKIDTEDMTAYGEMKHGVGAGLTITFSTRYNESDYKGMLDRQHAEFGRSGAPSDYTHTGTHEYGHAVAHSHGAPTQDEHGGGIRLDGPERIMRDTADRMSLDAGGKESGRGFKYRPDEQVSAGDFTVNQIGYYAATNHGEAFAEAFADVVSRGAHAAPLAKEVMSQVDSQYGPKAITWLIPLDAGRVYKRDRRGRFGSGDGEGEQAPAEEPKTGVDALPKMKKAPTVSAAAKGTNPNFGATGEYDIHPTYPAAGKTGKNWDPSMGPLPSGAYEENCTNCVHAFEMRMRGFDVEAAPLHVLDKHGYAAGRTYKETDEQIASSWTLPNGKPHGRSFAGQKWRSFEQIDSEIKAWPEGGRGFVTVGKHVFSVANVGGKAKYVEAQFDASPTRVVTAQYRKKYRGTLSSLSGERQEAKLVRLDDLKPADGILESVTAKS